MIALSPRAYALSLITFAAFIDIVAYSVAVSVLPDLDRTLGASPTTIGLLVAFFGVRRVAVRGEAPAGVRNVGGRLECGGRVA